MSDELPKEIKKLYEKLNGFLEYMVIEKGSSPLTIRNYKHYLTRFTEWANENGFNIDAEDIDQEVIRRFRLYLSRLDNGKGGTLSKKTQAYHVIALRSFLRWLVKHDHDVMSPDKIDIPKVSERQVKFLSGEQVDRFLNAPSLSTIYGKRDKAIIELLFSTGLRVSELVSLDRDSINLKRREFGVVGKGGRARVVFLSKRAAKWIERYLIARDDEFEPLFIRHRHIDDPTLTDEEVRLSARSVQRMFNKYRKKLQLPINVTPHVLRHSFATDLLMAGADIRSVQEMLGHKNIQTTQVYTHVTHKHLKDVHEAFHGKGGD